MEYTTLDPHASTKRPRMRTTTRIALVTFVALCLGTGAGVAIGWSLRPSSTTPSTASQQTSTSPPLAADEAVTHPTTRPQFLLLGDSITQWGANVTTHGWVSLLQADYAFSADVLNRGRAGDNTRKFIDRALPSLRTELTGGWIQPALITLWLGANDAVDAAGRHGSLHLSIAEYQKNLRFILREVAVLAPKAKIVLLTPSTVDADMRRDDQQQHGDAREPPDRTNEMTATYAAACKEVGEATSGVTVLDIYATFMATYPTVTERRGLTLDGLHLAAAGNTAVFTLVNEQIKKLVPQFVGRTGNDYQP